MEGRGGKGAHVGREDGLSGMGVVGPPSSRAAVAAAVADGRSNVT